MPTPKNKMTLEKFVAMMNESFEAVNKNLEGSKQELKDDIHSLRMEINSKFADLRRSHDYGPELDELRGRVKELEKKVGVRE